jgi:diadenosine tetraphosphate (Ap4A) HIT family hydrolase
MLYSEYLKHVTSCPFCDKEERYIEELETAFLTFAIAPYSKYHLLVIPKRHTESFLELTKEETADIEKLLHIGAKLLEKVGYYDYSILVRSGKEIGRSIKHLHYHLIPKIEIGSKSLNGVERQVLELKDIEEILKELGSFKATP